MDAFGMEFHSWFLDESVTHSVLYEELNAVSDGVFK